MRHRKHGGNFGRKPAHRAAMLRNLAINVFEGGRIRTTIQKAKAARPFVERLVTLGRRGTLHARRRAISLLGGNKRVAKLLFEQIAPRYVGRPGGYTRIVHLPRIQRPVASDSAHRWRRAEGLRIGDGARMVWFEFVDYQPPEMEPKEGKKKAEKE